MKLKLTLLLLLTLVSTVANACEGEQYAQLATIAITRCMHPDMTMSFQVPGRKSRVFVTVDEHDMRKLYDALKVYYEKEAK